MDVTTEDAKVYHKASASVKYIHQAISDELRSPSTAIICGSGLNGLSDSVQPHPRFEIPYGDIPHFPQSTGNEVLLSILLVEALIPIKYKDISGSCYLAFWEIKGIP